MKEPWSTYHNPRGIQKAWRVALIGGPLSLGWFLIVAMAPVQVPIIQAIALVSAIAVCIAVVRLGAERISTDHAGISVNPAFSRSAYVSWADLASLDVRVRTVGGVSRDDIEGLAAALFDLDSGFEQNEVVRLALVTRGGRRVALPFGDENTRRLIESGWREYSANFGRKLFND